MKFNERSRLISSTALSGVLVALMAAPASAAIDELVVTSQKRAESSQDVPISVSVVDANFLDSTGVDRVVDLIPFVPGFTGTAESLATTSWAVRGVSSNDFTASSEPSVGVYLDDAYIGRPQLSSNAFFDVERIEVLKGPQGTLFGRNAVAGAISVITNKPQYDAVTFDGGVQVGEEGTRKYEGALNLPLSDRFAVRVAMVRNELDGVQKNVVDGTNMELEDWAARVSLAGELTDTISANLSYHHYEVENNIARLHTGNKDWHDFVLIPDGGSGTGRGDDYADHIAQDGGNYENIDTQGANLRLTWDVSDSLTLESISDWRNIEHEASLDLDASDSLAFFVSLDFLQPGTEIETLSQEFRLNGTTDSLDWFVGASYYMEDTHELQELTNGDMSTTKGESDSIAVYGDVIWKATDRLSLTGGLRWTRDEKDWCTSNFAVFAYPDGELLGPNTGGFVCDSETWENISPRLVADFAVNDDVLLYASYSEGYKSGGFNTSVDAGLNVVSFEPEEMTAYEVGFKSTLMDGRLRLNGAAFLNDYTDIQVLSFVPNPEIGNAEEAETKGFELDALVETGIEGLNIGGNVAYLDAEFKDAFFNGAERSGNNLAFAPELTASAYVDYDIALANSGIVNIFSVYTWQDDQFHDGENTPYLEQDSLGLWNAKVSYTPSEGNWSLAIAGDNLTDEEYPARLSDSLGFGLPMVTRGLPRIIRLEANVSF